MVWPGFVVAVMLTVLFFVSDGIAAQADEGRYDVVWDSPSRDALDSMPLSGRKGAGANVWVQDGSLWIYPSHNGAYDEESRLLKLGCIRLTPAGIDLGNSESFRQRLMLADGSIRISQDGIRASLWFAGETLYVECETTEPISFDLAYGSWRDRERKGLSLDMYNTSQVLRADHLSADGNGIVWWHRNADDAPDLARLARTQGFEQGDVKDVVSDRVFGGSIAANVALSLPRDQPVQWQAWEGTAWTSRTSPARRLCLAVRLFASCEADPSSRRDEASRALDPDVMEQSRADEAARWREFWSRSFVDMRSSDAGNAGEKDRESDPAFLISRNYQLFRYMLACNRDGELPLLFNGGIFTVDNFAGRIAGNNNDELPIGVKGPSTPDFRRWMYCHFMSQNQRWLGWPALAGGDVDLLAPSLAFYRDRAPLAAARAKLQGAEGVVYPEPMNVWGLCCVHPLPNGLCGAEHLTYHFSMMLEHAWMALQANDALGVPLDQDLSWIVGTVFFYDSYYRNAQMKRTGSGLDAEGKLVLYPANGLEYAVGATDPIEVVAGLTRITDRLIREPGISATQRDRLKAIRTALPELPVGERDGKRSLLPARSFETGYNRWEPIEHYAAWPYRFVGVTNPETLELARDTWDTIPADRAQLCKQDYSWMANVVNMAACGWTQEAKRRAIYKLANNAAPQARFPAFFGPGHDWLPDHNWGGSGMTGIQEMLLAPQPSVDGKLYLLPAWPPEWDVHFKLHAPGRTTVEARVEGGKLVALEVTPASRAKDIIICAPYKSPATQP